MPRPPETPLELELRKQYQDTYTAIAVEQGKLELALEISTWNWHVLRCDAGVREPEEPEPGPALDFSKPPSGK